MFKHQLRDRFSILGSSWSQNGIIYRCRASVAQVKVISVTDRICRLFRLQKFTEMSIGPFCIKSFIYLKPFYYGTKYFSQSIFFVPEIYERKIFLYFGISDPKLNYFAFLYFSIIKNIPKSQQSLENILKQLYCLSLCFLHNFLYKPCRHR